VNVGWVVVSAAIVPYVVVRQAYRRSKFLMYVGHEERADDKGVMRHANTDAAMTFEDA